MHVHLALHHVPSVGAVGSLLLLGWGLFRKSIDVTVVALVAFVLVALIAVPVYLSGNSAEEVVARMPDVPMALVVSHRDSALAAMIGIVSAAFTAVAALYVWRSTRRFPGFAATATLIVGIAAVVLVLRTSSLGGQIRHAESRAPSSAVAGR